MSNYEHKDEDTTTTGISTSISISRSRTQAEITSTSEDGDIVGFVESLNYGVTDNSLPDDLNTSISSYSCGDSQTIGISKTMSQTQSEEE